MKITNLQIYYLFTTERKKMKNNPFEVYKYFLYKNKIR